MGWIKIWREDEEMWKNLTPVQSKILTTILLMVNFKENDWVWKGERHKLSPGQTITSIESIRAASSQNKSDKRFGQRQVRTALEKFSTLGFLTSETTNHGSLITIRNFNTYPLTAPPADKHIDKQPTNSRQTADKQPTNQPTTIEEDKEGKKDKKVRINSKIAAADYLRSLKIEEAKIVSIFKTKKVEDIINAIELTVERDPERPAGYFLSIVEKDNLPPSKAGKERRKKAAEASRVAAQEAKDLKARARDLEEDRAAQAELKELEAAHASMGDEDLAGVEKVIDRILAAMRGSFRPKRENLRLGAVKEYLKSKEELCQEKK